MSGEWAGGVRSINITIKWRMWRMRKWKTRKAVEDKESRSSSWEQVQEQRWVRAQRCEMTPRNWSPRLPHLHTHASSFLGGAALGFWSFTHSLCLCSVNHISAQAALCTEVSLATLIQPWRMNSASYNTFCFAPLPFCFQSDLSHLLVVSYWEMSTSSLCLGFYLTNVSIVG